MNQAPTDKEQADYLRKKLEERDELLSLADQRYQELFTALRALRTPESEDEKWRLDGILNAFAERGKEDPVFMELVDFAGQMLGRARAQEKRSDRLNQLNRQLRAEFLDKSGLPEIDRPNDGKAFCVGSSINTGNAEFVVGQMLYQVVQGPMRYLTIYDLEGKARSRLVLAEVPVPQQEKKGGQNGNGQPDGALPDAPKGAA